uniref:3-beta hydroxysteroid dehydrogenase/isomerase domain-containing protein n=1 Tax=Meloidogyne incognita TaxID=6306 RepID=A0A914N1R6_MELIC
MKKITILGANTLLGHHLVTVVDNVFSGIDKTLWNYNDKRDGLKEAIEGSGMVINLHELQDLSLTPNMEELNKNNVEFVSELISYCKTSNVSVLVHLSTTYLQCSTKWPNVYGRESEDFGQFLNDFPFPSYCKSKLMAEEFLRNDLDNKISIVISRVGPIYGEGDRRSLVCDTLLVNKYFGFFPRIGNHKDMGVLQFTYAGNVAFSLLSCGQKLMNSEKNSCETVLICDDTPLHDFYSLILDGILDSKEVDTGHEEIKKTSTWTIPFWLIFFPYLFICWLVQLITNISNLHLSLNYLPSPNLIYLLLRHWTFYSGYKLRVFFDVKPFYDWETCLKRSRLYYTNLKTEEIEGPSWLSSTIKMTN